MTLITAEERQQWRHEHHPDQPLRCEIDKRIIRLLDALKAAEVRLVSAYDAENSALEQCDVLRHQLAAERERAEKAERKAERHRHERDSITEMWDKENDDKLALLERITKAEQERDALLMIAERFAPCPFVLYLNSDRSLYKEDCATCQPKKKERLACLLEWAAAKTAKGADHE
ncbi:hypothetical protein LJC59_00055 [Desulfovibrio sp. OttesenSCG-928-A18]|nr:hypothetical protein [Desulfovibrio sp. OttesenSCG-928-A18]